jgi:hypothetical protein
MRKLLTAVLLALALTTVGTGVAYAGNHPPKDGDRACTADQVLVNAQCVKVEVSPQVNVPELGVGAVVDDLTDTVTDLVGGLL